MIKAHIYLDGELYVQSRQEHCYRVGDTVRLNDKQGGDKYAKVTEVVWCLNEYSREGQRVNIRLESEGA